jgi:hypothetical protein
MMTKIIDPITSKTNAMNLRSGWLVWGIMLVKMYRSCTGKIFTSFCIGCNNRYKGNNKLIYSHKNHEMYEVYCRIFQPELGTF